MKTIEKLELWSEQHSSGWIDVLRFFLGLVLIVKGFMFIADTTDLVRILNVYLGITDGVIWAHSIAILHLATGFLITIGLATRICCLVDIPLVMAAIIFVNSHSGVTGAGELILSIVVLMLLIFFMIKGSGRASAYYYLVNSKRSRQTDESRKDYQGGSTVPPLDKDANIV